MSKLGNLFPLPDTLSPWKRADEAAGYSMTEEFFTFEIRQDEIYFWCLSGHCFGVSALHFPEIICQSNSVGNTL